MFPQDFTIIITIGYFIWFYNIIIKHFFQSF